MIALAHAGRAERRLAHREAGEHPGRSAGIAQRQRPAVAARRRLEREDGAEARRGRARARGPTPRAAPPSGRPRSPCRCRRDRSARRRVVARTTKSSASSSSDGKPGADRDVERAAGEVEHVPRDHEALERRRADPGALARREVVDPGDVAVGQEAAQLALEAIRRGRRRPAPPAPRTVGRRAPRRPRTRWPSPRARSAARRGARAVCSMPTPAVDRPRRQA